MLQILKVNNKTIFLEDRVEFLNLKLSFINRRFVNLVIFKSQILTSILFKRRFVVLENFDIKTKQKDLPKKAKLKFKILISKLTPRVLKFYF